MNQHYILTLMNTPKIGRKTIKKIIDLMDFTPAGLQDLHDLLKTLNQNNTRIKLPSIEHLKEASLTAENIIITAENMGIKILGFTDPGFPQRLKNIIDPPVILYAKGNTDCLNKESNIAVIGTRQPSEYGRNMAECFGMLFGEFGLVVVSGLAIGCDTAAHQGCLNVNGRTIAILANGLDTIYPKRNSALAENILESSGCLLSEYPPDSKIMSNFFVERDRLQSGLSEAVVIVETDLKGGTMHTAKFAIEQNKILACLDHPDNMATSKSNGNKKLILEDKAFPIRDLNDVEDLTHRVIKMLLIDKPDSSDINSMDTGKQLTIPLD